MEISQDHASPVPGKSTIGNARSSAPAKTVKLSADLIMLAEAEAGVAQRSTPKQIEYWSLLGRVVEKYLRKDESHALLSEQKAITQITLDDVFPTPDVVMSGLEQSRASGELSASVTFATESFEAVDGTNDLFKKIHADGSEVLGRLVDGEFVASR